MDIQTLDTVIYYTILGIVFIISIGFHEYAHAYVSYKLWDPTPKLQWRLTPNPLKHIDPVGFILIFLIHFWWWKPVQINPNYYKNPLRDELLTSLAWPFTNFLIAFVWMFIWVLLQKFGQSNYLIDIFFQLLVFVNIALAIFNLLPIYPLDWYRIIKFLKPSWGYFMEQNSFIFLWILLLLVFMPGNIVLNIIISVVEPIYIFLYYIASFIIWL